MARKCIICGNKAGSREHIFPASLGGRRTNKGIYCGKHNGAYSPLAKIISEQLAIFNALLGVQGDHADHPTQTTLKDVASGRDIKLDAKSTRFAKPEILSERIENGKTLGKMAFSSNQEIKEWIEEQRAKGVAVTIVDMEKPKTYYLGPAHKRITLGGTEEGMRAVAYIGQTYLAHCFPDAARSHGLYDFKKYTLENIGGGQIWWDFDPARELPPNKFEFGHRIIVALNKETQSAYATISFFSTLNFAMIFGTVPVTSSRAVITDVDPLAKSPPHDIHTWTDDDVATGWTLKPGGVTAGLGEAISSGKVQEKLSDLVHKIEDYDCGLEADRISSEISKAGALSKSDREKALLEVVSRRAQRVLKLTRALAMDYKHRARSSAEHLIAKFLEDSAETDPTSENGLTPAATAALRITCEALAKQMNEDFDSGSLNRERLKLLFCGGVGMYTVGTALLHHYIERFPG